jgi:hypothetical protein
MLAKSAKFKWGMGHQALKIIYSGAIKPILTYGAPILEKALTKQFENISACSKNDEYQNSQGIQNTVL